MEKVIALFVSFVLTFSVFTTSPVVWADGTVTTEGFYSLCAGARGYVSIDNEGGIYYSNNLVDWNMVVYRSSDKFYKIVFAKDKFYAIAKNKTLYSPDGIEWKELYDHSINGVSDLQWVKDKFIAVGYCKILTSNDGYTWFNQDSKGATYLSSVIYDGSNFIIAGGYAGSGRIMQSTGGANWNPWYELMDNCGDASFTNIFWTGSGYVFQTSFGGMFYSQDLSSGKPLSNMSKINSIAIGRGQLLATSGNGFIYSSKDGQNWKKMTLAFSSSDRLMVKYIGNSFYLFVAKQSGTFSYKLNDNQSWGEPAKLNIDYDTSHKPTPGQVKTVTTPDVKLNTASIPVQADLPDFIDADYGNGRYVAIDNQGGIAVSENQTDWNYVLFKSENAFKKIIWGNNEFIILAEGKLFRSNDGIKWEELKHYLTQRDYLDIIWANGLYVAVGEKGNITSKDGIVWESQYYNGAEYMKSVTYDGTNFIVAGTFNRVCKIVKSTDGIHWTRPVDLFNYSSLIPEIHADKSSFDQVEIKWGQGCYLLKFSNRYILTKDLKTCSLIRRGPTDEYKDQVYMYDIAANDKYILGVGLSGEVTYSSDQATWIRTAVPNCNNYDFRKIKFINGQFVILGGSKRTKLWITTTDLSEYNVNILENINTDVSKDMAFEVTTPDADAMSGAVNTPATTPKPLPTLKDLPKGLIEKLLKQSAVVLKIDNNRCLVSDKLIPIDSNNSSVAPAIINDSTYVPVRFIAESFGAKVDWNNESQTVVIKMGDKTIKITIGISFMMVNDQRVNLGTPAMIVNNRTLLPLRGISEAMGKSVYWDASHQLIIISDGAISLSDDDKMQLESALLKDSL